MNPEHEQICRFMFEDRPVRGEIIRLTQSYQAAVNNHSYPLEVATLLGQSLAAAALLSATIKYEGKLILQTQTDGFINPLIAQSDNNLHIRGIAKFSQESPVRLPLLGKGQLAISLIPNNNTERYQGIVNIRDNDLASSLEDYFEQSEQLATRIWLFANENTAAGLFLQEMPSNDSTDDDFFNHVTALASTIKADELFTLPFKDILNRLYVENPVRLFKPQLVTFRCSCDISKIENTVKTFDEAEIQQILTEHQAINITCEFCNQTFTFSKVDVARILQQKQS